MRRELLLLSLLMAGCTPQNGERANAAPTPQPAAEQARAAADTTAVRGTVAVVGSAPVNVAVVVREANGGSTLVEGPLAPEIGRLSGAEVEVTGTRRPDPLHGQSVHATDYVVHAVDGRPVVSGVVERRPDGRLQLRADDGRTITLSGGEDHLRPGQKVWVQGPVTVQVQSYGVIRP
jgi:hypothetical protein